MEKANRIMSTEVEHQIKMGVAGRKWARVDQVETASPPSKQLTQPSSSQTPRNESTKSKKRIQSQIHWRAAGVHNCDHCFKCGSTDHFTRGCRRASGNGQMLCQRDRV